MPFYTFDGDGAVIEQFRGKKQAGEAYERDNTIHLVADQSGRVWAGEQPADAPIDIQAGIAAFKAKQKADKKVEKEPTEKAASGGQKGGRGCPTCKVQMLPGLPASDDKRLRGTAYRKCPQCDFTRWHPIAHVAMLLAGTGWPTYRDTLGGGQRAARRVIELAMEGVPGPDAYAQVVEESKGWTNWAPGRTAQRSIRAKELAAEKERKAAEREAKAAERAAAKEAKAAERAAEKERAAAEKAAAKAAAADERAATEQVDGQITVDEVLADA